MASLDSHRTMTETPAMKSIDLRVLSIVEAFLL